jgi:hypothetical protein
MIWELALPADDIGWKCLVCTDLRRQARRSIYWPTAPVIRRVRSPTAQTVAWQLQLSHVGYPHVTNFTVFKLWPSRPHLSSSGILHYYNTTAFTATQTYFHPSKETIFLSPIVILIINQILQKLGFLFTNSLSIIGIFINGLLVIVLLYSFRIIEI